MFESEAHTERGSPSLVGRGIANPQEFPSCNEFETVWATIQRLDARITELEKRVSRIEEK
jgi:hypothetical protein